MKFLIIATGLVMLSLSATQGFSQGSAVNPNGPQPYRAVDPVYSPMTPEAVVPTAAYVPPMLFLKGDDTYGSDAGPQPYAAPTPSYK